MEAVVDRNQASALADLQMHWDEAYVIGFDGEVWSARFRGSDDLLCARTSSDVRELIRADYVHRQRPGRLARPARQSEKVGEDRQPAGDDAQPAGDDAQPAGDDAQAADDVPAVADQTTDDLEPTAGAFGSVDFGTIRGERMST